MLGHGPLPRSVRPWSRHPTLSNGITTSHGPAVPIGATDHPGGSGRLPSVGRLPDVDLAGTAERVGAYIDHHHPKVVRALLGVRWGGLRTVELDPTGWTALLVAGAASGVAVRSGARAARRARGATVPRSATGLLGAAALGGTVAWFCCWRWDTRRWRGRHVALTVNLPASDLEALAAELQAVAAVETWEDPVGPGGARRGLLVPTRDVRAVNAALGARDGWFRSL
jgi:hypothetical protein